MQDCCCPATEVLNELKSVIANTLKGMDSAKQSSIACVSTPSGSPRRFACRNNSIDSRFLDDETPPRWISKPGCALEHGGCTDGGGIGLLPAQYGRA